MVKHRYMKKKAILVLFLSLLIVPIICNLIVGTTNVTNIEVVGTNVDWLGFYGSYIGSVIAALTSFYVLMKQLEQSERNIQKEHAHQEIIKTIEDLADRFSKYTPSEAIRLSKYTDITGDGLNEELDYLQVQFERYRALAYSAFILYSNEDRDSPGFEFFIEYSSLMNDTVQCINDAIGVISKYNKARKQEDNDSHTDNIGEYEREFKDNMLAISHRIMALDERNKHVLELANKYQEWLTNNFNKL